MQLEQKIQGMRETLGHETRRKGDEIVFFCPKHPAKAGRTEGQLSVNLVSEEFNCWSCGFKGRDFVQLFKKGSPARREYIAEIEQRTRPLVKPEKQFEPCVLPPEFRTLSRDWGSLHQNAALRYLLERGLDWNDVVRWKLGYCETGDYAHRIIVPSFDEYGLLNFFTGRSYYGNPRRYKTGNICKDIIFNDYLIDWNAPLTITEGPFDAFKVSQNVTALQGNILAENSKLFSKIIFSGVDVYFAMDQDAFKRQLKLIQLLFSYGVNCYYIPMLGKKDVGEMSKNEFTYAKSQALPAGSSTDLLKLRMQA